jgi:hypothetical protein
MFCLVLLWLAGAYGLSVTLNVWNAKCVSILPGITVAGAYGLSVTLNVWNNNL